MANGQKTELTYDYGTCGECNYNVEQLVADHPNGTSDAQATSRLIRVGDEFYLIVIPHRSSCSQYNHTLTQYSPKTLFKGE